MHSSIPSSPDPTPLRLLAFSVAEAALQPDPNSPSLNMQLDGDWTGSWCESKKVVQPKRVVKSSGKLWDVVERAKERRESECSPT